MLSHQVYLFSRWQLLDPICLGEGLSQLMPLDFWFENLETQGFPFRLDEPDKQNFSGESCCWYARENLTGIFLQVHYRSQTALELGFISESLRMQQTHLHLKAFLLCVTRTGMANPVTQFQLSRFILPSLPPVQLKNKKSCSSSTRLTSSLVKN